MKELASVGLISPILFKYFNPVTMNQVNYSVINPTTRTVTSVPFDRAHDIENFLIMSQSRDISRSDIELLASVTVPTTAPDPL